jgi:uncharacterized protein DUF3237
MRLEYLCDMNILVNEAQAMVKPHGSEEGSLFVLGGGEIAGERLRGTIRCANHAHRRSDGAMMPDLDGTITTTDGAAIVFHMRGLTTFRTTAEGLLGDQVSWMSFETESEPYRWLNSARCVVEGAVRIVPGRGATGPNRVYICVNEML